MVKELPTTKRRVGDLCGKLLLEDPIPSFSSFYSFFYYRGANLQNMTSPCRKYSLNLSTILKDDS